MLPAKAHRAPGAPVVAARALTLAAVLALLGAGCGDEDDDDGADDASAGGTELTLTLDADGPGGEEARTEQVSCEPRVDGSPCARIATTDFAILDPATPCTEIYGGPDEASVEGTVDGDEVSIAVTRANGCEIQQFERFTPLLRELFPNYEPGAAIAP